MRRHRITAVMAAMFCMILMAGCGNSKAVQEQQMTLRSQGMEQAKELFDVLRELDDIGAKKVFARCPNKDGVGLAVYNRLLRAAGFQVVKL